MFKIGNIKDKVIGLGIDALKVDIPVLYRANRELASKLKILKNKLHYKVFKKIYKEIWEIAKNGIDMKEISIKEDKIVNMIARQYATGRLEMDKIIDKIKRMYDAFINSSEVKYIIENVLFETNGIYDFITTLWNITKCNVRYEWDIEESSNSYTFYFSIKIKRREIKLIAGKIYKRQVTFAGDVTFYGMFFRLLELGYLEDIAEVCYSFLSNIKGIDIQRLDIYIDYNGDYIKPEFRKNAKWQSGIYQIGSSSPTYYYTKGEFLIRIYNTYEDKLIKGKLNEFYPELKKDSKRIEVKIRNSAEERKRHKNTKIGDFLQKITRMEGLYDIVHTSFVDIFGVDINEFYDFKRNIMFQTQEILLSGDYIPKQQIKVEEDKVEIDVYHILRTIQGLYNKIKSQVDIQDVVEFLETGKIEKKIKKSVLKDSIVFSLAKIKEESNKVLLYWELEQMQKEQEEEQRKKMEIQLLQYIMENKLDEALILARQNKYLWGKYGKKIEEKIEEGVRKILQIPAEILVKYPDII